jgi:phosphoserine phosphatase
VSAGLVTEPVPHRGVALLDVDGTLTSERSVWQYVLDACGRWSGPGEENLARYLAEEIDYEEFCRLDADLLAGESYARLCHVAASIPLNPGVPELFVALRANGYKVALISTGLRLLTGHLERIFPVDYCVANDLAVDGDRCTGLAVVEIGEKDKGMHARKAIEHLGGGRVVAIGDGTGDIPMFELADLAIAVGAVNDAVRAAADVHLPVLDLSTVGGLL